MTTNNFFPKPTDLVQETPFQHCINNLRDRILNHDFLFIPEYQHRKWLGHASLYLKDFNWSLQTEGEKWKITPMV